MFVTKRNGKTEAINFDKVHKRIAYLVSDPHELKNINAAELSITVIGGLINNIKTTDIDVYTANVAAALGTKHRDYIVLAARVLINNHQKNTLNSFADKISLFYLKKDTIGNPAGIISHDFNKFVNINKVAIDSHINYTRDNLVDYFGFKTLEKGYLLSINGEVIERPQDLFMRVAIQIYMPNVDKFGNKDCLKKMFHTYDMMSQQYYTHATPTLFNSGSNNPNLSSCFLLGSEDSIGGIMKTLTDSVNISKWSGGVGLHVSMWRGKDSLIRGTNGQSGGIVPFLRMFNDGARAFNQGGKRNGSFATYLEPHHPDIMEFLSLRLTHGDENERCRDLFTALWISDLFMERVKANGKWSTFCPDTCPDLNMVYGEEYKALYLKYESEGRQVETIDAIKIWKAIYESHKQSGIPYMCYKDNVNHVNMQNNIGIINSSNLCVSGDTMILVDSGYVDIKTLAETKPPVHNVWSCGQYTPATFGKTGTARPLLIVTTKNGYSIKCTPYHKFIIFSTTNGVESESLVEAKNLKIGSRISNVISMGGPNAAVGFVDDEIATIGQSPTLEDTYCFNEPINHRGVFNNLLTGQCTEINIHSSETETGTCFTGDTQVLTIDGYRRIDECDGKKILSYFNNDKDLQHDEIFTEAKLINNGFKEVYELECTSIDTIKVTSNHLFLAYISRNRNTKINTYSWKELKDLQVGDKILIPSTKILPSYDVDTQLQDISTGLSNLTLTEKNYVVDDYLTIGWMIGDGWQCHTNKDQTGSIVYGVCFGPTDTYARDRVLLKLNEWKDSVEVSKGGHDNPTNYTTDKRTGVFSWVSSKKQFVKKIQDDFGLMVHKASEKIIPEKIIKSDPTNIAAVLSGIFSADGTVFTKDKDSENNRKLFHVALSSSSKTLLHQVQNLLKCFGIKSNVVWSYIKSRNNYQGVLTIKKPDSLRAYKKYIGFMLCIAKQEKLNYGIENLLCDREIFTDYVTIKSITLKGLEQVYDLNVPTTHNFIVEGLVVHNCNLASICLPMFVEDTHSQIEIHMLDNERRVLNHEFPVHPKMNWKLLADVASDITENLNSVIDNTFNPTVEAARSNFKHRPIGIGIQGLADVFLKFGVAFDSEEAREINKKISEAIYYGSLSKSSEMCRSAYMRITNTFDTTVGYKHKIFTEKVLALYPILESENIVAEYDTVADIPKTIGAYSSYLQGSGAHIANGKFHWEMSGLTNADLSGMFDWETLRSHIKIYGVKNSLTTAYMPTGTTSQIMGCSPCIEPYVSNIYKRTTLAGTYTVVNKYLVKYLHDAGLYNENFNKYMIANEGSIQNIEGIPESVKALYKTAWELKQKSIVQLAVDRQPFIDQSQSMNVFFEDYNMNKFTAIQFFGWSNKLKTGSYYVRTREAVMPKKFTISHEMQQEIEMIELLKKQKAEELLLKEDDEQVCLMCSS